MHTLLHVEGVEIKQNKHPGLHLLKTLYRLKFSQSTENFPLKCYSNTMSSYLGPFQRFSKVSKVPCYFANEFYWQFLCWALFLLLLAPWWQESLLLRKTGFQSYSTLLKPKACRPSPRRHCLVLSTTLSLEEHVLQLPILTITRVFRNLYLNQTNYVCF